MANARPTSLHDKLLAETERAQAGAADPSVSAWVSANAGTGKTHVLKLRVLRLLLAGTPPEKILCLTYTKAAAAEMATRVFDELSHWATAREAELKERLTGVLSRRPSPEEEAAARQLFARAIETPGGLKVQTIHAFCERLLQRFPLEAGVPPGFTILDEATGTALLREAIDLALLAATRDRRAPLGRALETAVAFAAGDGFDDVLRSALAQRDWVEHASRLALRGGDAFETAGALYRRAFGVRPGVGRAEIDAELAAVLTPDAMRRCAAALADGGKTDRELAQGLAAAAKAAQQSQRIEALQAVFLTKQMEPRSDSRFGTKAIRERHPAVHDQLVRVRDRFAELCREAQGLVTAEASVALLRLADAVMQRYGELKAQRAVLDFDDLIRRTSSLLALSSAAEWVLYKLDGGLDHILVDEAQDTSSPQWRVIEALAREFFSGTGARETARTLFAVGDEKQSIYSFQGAEPKMFAETGERFAGHAREAALLWRNVPLTLSFRSVSPVLDAVDRVFADHQRTPGLTAAADPIRHAALRVGHAGLVELWPTEKPVEANPAEAWAPLAEGIVASPVNRLAARIADTIKGWLDNGERLVSEDRPIRPGDILIMVRKRRPFAGPMVAALKARGIPVAGTDRLNVIEQIAVMDLMSLADFLVLPEDDLALAEVLKSPLFDLGDDDLISLAPGRQGTLWKRLLEAAEAEPRFAEAAQTLKRWRALADLSPPFEFFARVLDNDGARRKLMTRLGSEAADPLTEFLNLALQYEEAAAPSLVGFLDWLRRGAREIKRDMEHGRDEVRVLTVHGAKGLEAPVVFLPDTCSSIAGRRSSQLVELRDATWPVGAAPFAWPVKGANRLTAIEIARQAAEAEEAEERNRLLYVAMTRARDRLYVAGFEGTRGRSPGCWYEQIEAGLDGILTKAVRADGLEVRRLEVKQMVMCETRSEEAQKPIAPAAPPEWSRRPAPAEPQLAIPITPSRLAPLDFDAEGEPTEPRMAGTVPHEPAAPSPLALAEDHRFLRGTLTHGLLEHLPTLDSAGWERAARSFVEQRGRALSPRARESIVAETLAVLRDPTFAPVFGPGSRAEVPIIAEIPSPLSSAPALRVVGQIDRLIRLDHAIMILDYKTNRPPPKNPDEVAAAYLYQLAAYCLAAQRIFKGLPVRAAILWTDGPRLMEIPAALIEAYRERLWRLHSGCLDG
jgi:ATP-dependent helicase/nuclease subunit A